MFLDKPGVFILFSSTLISTLFLCVFLLFKKRVNKNSKLFILSIFFFCLDNLRQFLYVYGTKLEFQPKIIHYFHFTLLIPVLILISIRKKNNLSNIILILIPFAIEYSLIFLILGRMIPYNSYLNWYAPMLKDVFFCLFMVYIYLKYRKKLINTYALNIINTFLVLSFLTSLIRIFEFISVITKFEGYTFGFYFEIVLNFFVLLIIAYSIILYIIENKSKKIINKKERSFDDSKYDTFFKDYTVLNLIKEEEKFLDPELSIEKLAVNYGIDSKLLSNIIKSKYSLNFNSFINKLRIDYFLASIHNGEHNKLTIMAIAEKSGFKSKSTFNRVFKEQLGKTPKEYILDNKF